MSGHSSTRNPPSSFSSHTAPQRLATIPSVSSADAARTAVASTSGSHSTPNTPRRHRHRPSYERGSSARSSSQDGHSHHRSLSNGPSSPTRATSHPDLLTSSAQTPDSKGKRKADDLDTTPPGSKDPSPGSQRIKGKTRFSETPAALAVENGTRREKRVSGSSSTTNPGEVPPSAYHRAKRPRLSTTPSEVEETMRVPHRSASRASTKIYSKEQRPRSPSLSGRSIPISALISPHAPSLTPSGAFHMRDPRKPRIEPTGWTVSLPVPARRPRVWPWQMDYWRGWTERGGSPAQSFLFFVGFIIFPLWFVGGFLAPVPKTRHLVGDVEASNGGTGNGVLLDDPQLEFDAKTWRKRCRIAALVSLLTYLPFIIIVAYFGSRA